VSDKEALSARDILASNGIFVEPSGAVSYAGVMKKKLSGTVVAVATGHGLKDMIGI
jgi:threonine synthase